MLVRVAFEFQLDKTYDYAVPDELQNSVEVGIRVEASLGHSTRTGYIIGLNPPRSHSVKYKYFNKIIEPEPIITPALMKLSEFVANYYCSSRGKTLRCFLPASVRKRPASAALVHVVRPAKSLEEIHEQSSKILKRAPRHASVLKHLSEFYSTTIDKKCVLRLSELSARADVQPNVIRLLETRGWLEISLEKIDTEVDGTFIPSGAPKLNKKQSEAINSVLESRDKFNTFLLYGITGSGKTEVYLQVIHDAVKRGKGAIVLVPEIALTPQTVERFRSRFGEDVAVLHSNLADLERFKQWWNIRDGKARIVVGA
ncbi:DEAD/DEAH box helicase family protein, partial [bacterium]|nr:DEAD/DEAH box helicase family protein [bacterium]